MASQKTVTQKVTDGAFIMKKEPLSIPQYYSKKLKDKRSESEILQKFAKKIKKAPDTIKIPSEYLNNLGNKN